MGAVAWICFVGTYFLIFSHCTKRFDVHLCDNISWTCTKGISFAVFLWLKHLHDQEITVKLQLSTNVKSTCSSDINVVPIQQSSRDIALYLITVMCSLFLFKLAWLYVLLFAVCQANLTAQWNASHSWSKCVGSIWNRTKGNREALTLRHTVKHT